MNETEFITHLARASGVRPASVPDLSGRVIISLQKSSPPDNDKVWSVIACAGCIVAAVALVGAVQCWSTLLNPLQDLAQPSIAMEMR